MTLTSFIGISICLGSSLSSLLCGIIVKHLNHVNPLIITAARFYMVALLSMPIAATKASTAKDQTFEKRQYFLLILRGIVGAVNSWLFFYGFQHLPLGDAFVIGASSHIFTVLFARLFIKESIVIADIINVFLVLTGIVCIVKPPFLFGNSYDDPQTFYAAIAMVFASAFLESNIYVLIRLLKNIDWSITNTFLGLIGCTQAICLLLVFKSDICLPELGSERLYMVLTGVLTFFGKYFLQVAALYESAASISLLKKAFDVLLAFTFQIFLFKVRS